MENKNNKTNNKTNVEKIDFPRVSISNGNSKMGPIPSVSLPPVITCRKNAPCLKECYAIKLCKLRPTVKSAYDRNFEIYKNDPDIYFLQVSAAMKTTKYFRVHVSGDIPDAEYFARLVDVVRENAHCTVLMFTKQFEIVNAYIQEQFKNWKISRVNQIIPENFKIIFSNWNDWKCENPYNFPTTNVIFKNTVIPDDWKICGGNCQQCACRGCGCWEVKNGETIAFYKH